MLAYYPYYLLSASKQTLEIFWPGLPFHEYEGPIMVYSQPDNLAFSWISYEEDGKWKSGST